MKRLLLLCALIIGAATFTQAQKAESAQVNRGAISSQEPAPKIEKIATDRLINQVVKQQPKSCDDKGKGKQGGCCSDKDKKASASAAAPTAAGHQGKGKGKEKGGCCSGKSGKGAGCGSKKNDQANANKPQLDFMPNPAANQKPQRTAASNNN